MEVIFILLLKLEETPKENVKWSFLQLIYFDYKGEFGRNITYHSSHFEYLIKFEENEAQK